MEPSFVRSRGALVPRPSQHRIEIPERRRRRTRVRREQKVRSVHYGWRIVPCRTRNDTSVAIRR